MTGRPLLSVVVPVRNDRRGLHTTLGALQSLPIECLQRMECIVVDGGSSDGSVAALAEFPGLVTHLLAQTDDGVYDAMNRGVALAKGHWVWFLGAGDCPNPDGVHEAMARLQTLSKDAGLAASVATDARREAGVPSLFSPSWSKALWWRNTIHHQGLWAPRAWLNELPFDASLKVLGDYAWLLDMKLRHKPLECHPQWTLAQVGSGGLSRQFHASLYFEEWRMKQGRTPLPVRLAQAVWLPAKWAFKQSSKVANSLGASTSQ